MSGTILATHAPAPAGTAASLRSHYNAVRSRLWGRAPVNRPVAPPPTTQARAEPKRPPIIYPPKLRRYPHPIGPVRPIRRGITIRAIVAAVACEFRIDPHDLTGTRRLATYVEARQAAYHVARNTTALSLVQIGKVFGGKDHTTVLHGVRKSEGRCATDPAYAERINSVLVTLRGMA